MIRKLSRKRAPGLVFFMFAIGMFFLLGFLFGQMTAHAEELPEFILGWIPTDIGFTDEAGDFIGVSGACMVAEDLEILIQKYPGIMDEVYEFETEPEIEEPALDKTEYTTL